MINSLSIDNPHITRPQLALQRPALPIHAGKGGLRVALDDVYSHCALRDDAGDALRYRLQRDTFDNDFRRLINFSVVMGLAAK